MCYKTGQFYLLLTVLNTVFLRQAAALEKQKLSQLLTSALAQRSEQLHPLTESVDDKGGTLLRLPLTPLTGVNAAEQRVSVKQRVDALLWQRLHTSLEITQEDEYSLQELSLLQALSNELQRRSQQDRQDSFSYLLERLDEAYELLHAFISLAFRKPYGEDPKLRRCLQEQLWDSQVLKNYLGNPAAYQELFAHLYLETHTLAAVDQLEVILHQYVSHAQDAHARNELKMDYPLLETVLNELGTLFAIICPQAAPQQQKVTASDTFKNLIAELVGGGLSFKFKLFREDACTLSIIMSTPINQIPSLTHDEISKRLRQLDKALCHDLATTLKLAGDAYDTLIINDFSLKITAPAADTLNQIGALLKDAGLKHWDQHQLSTSHTFFWQDHQPLEKREIGCSLQ